MDVIADLDPLAVLVAAVAGFVIGAIWYSVLAKPWMAAAGKTPEDLEQSAGLYIRAAGLQLVMAFALAMVIERSAIDTIHCGVLTGVVIGLGLVTANKALNANFAGTAPMLVLIDGGHATLAFAVQGAILAAWG